MHPDGFGNLLRCYSEQFDEPEQSTLNESALWHVGSRAKMCNTINRKLSHCGICFRSAALWKDEVTLIFVWQGKGPNKGR